jgi:hypothetical protein
MLDLPLVRFAPDVVMQVIGHEAVLVNLQTEAVFALNSTAARTTQLIVEQQPWTVIVDTLAAEYGVTADEVRSAVAELVTALVRQGLLLTQPSA